MEMPCLLNELEYLSKVKDDFEVTDNGLRLARIYGERDLLVAECLRRGVWQESDPANLAAIAAALIYEARRDDDDPNPKVPRGQFADIMQSTLDVWEDVEWLAKSHKLNQTSQPDPTLSLAMHRWASGAKLDTVLSEADLLPGDFIRWTKQIVDMLDQIAQTGEGKVSDTARKAIDLVKRGIVAYSYFY